MHLSSLFLSAVTLFVPAPDARVVVAETPAAAVAQAFVDAANRRDLAGMMATLAPDVVFSVLPSGEILADNRDAAREFYRQLLGSLTPDFVGRIARRIDGESFVVDLEEFYEGEKRMQNRSAVWIYWVKDGLIRHAWGLREPPK